MSRLLAQIYNVLFAPCFSLFLSGSDLQPLARKRSRTRNKKQKAHCKPDFIRGTLGSETTRIASVVLKSRCTTLRSMKARARNSRCSWNYRLSDAIFIAVTGNMGAPRDNRVVLPRSSLPLPSPSPSPRHGTPFYTFRPQPKLIKGEAGRAADLSRPGKL